MPEIAEVETVRRTLKNKILNKKIIDIDIRYSKMIESNIDEFKKNIIGNSIIDIKRRGKWLIFDLGKYSLLSHLRMEGKYFIKDKNEEINKHEHVIFYFDDGVTLRYHDTRKFGRMNLVLTKDVYDTEEIKKQGYEPNEKELTKEYLVSKFKNKRLPIKSVLLDQTIISGLGNIYADEVLFKSGIDPLRIASSITLDEADKIVKSSGEIIKQAIIDGGTTIRSYTSSLGVTGRFQQHLMVHKREKEACKNCGTIIERIKVGGRSTYFCKNCQK